MSPVSHHYNAGPCEPQEMVRSCTQSISSALSPVYLTRTSFKPAADAQPARQQARYSVKFSLLLLYHGIEFKNHFPLSKPDQNSAKGNAGPLARTAGGSEEAKAVGQLVAPAMVSSCPSSIAFIRLVVFFSSFINAHSCIYFARLRCRLQKNQGTPVTHTRTRWSYSLNVL